MLIFNKDITVNLRVVTGKASLALEDNLRFGKFNDVEIWEMLDTIFVGNNDGEDRLSEIVRTSIGDVIEEYMSDITVNPRIERLLGHKYSFENVKGSFLAEFMTEYMWSYYGLRDVMAKLYAEQLKVVRSRDSGFCAELWGKIVKTIRNELMMGLRMLQHDRSYVKLLYCLNALRKYYEGVRDSFNLYSTRIEFHLKSGTVINDKESFAILHDECKFAKDFIFSTILDRVQKYHNCYYGWYK